MKYFAQATLQAIWVRPSHRITRRICAMLCGLLLIYWWFIYKSPAEMAQLHAIAFGQLYPWLHSLSLRRYVFPERNSSLIEPAAACAEPGLLLAVVVPSAPGNAAARRAIRRTWGRPATDGSTSTMFLVGRADSDTLQAQLSAEAAAHGDVLQEDFPDHYNNLTIKTVFMLKWLTHRCPSVPFVLKADDDMWVDMPALLQYLRDCRLPGGACADGAALMAGLLYHQAPTDRTPGSKWYLPPALRAEEPLPDYISGTAYLLTGSAVAPLWWRALETPFINLEDVFLSGLVAPRAGVRLQRAPGFEKTRPLWQHPCTCRHHLTVHGLAPAVIERLYRERRRPCGGLLWSLVNLVMIWVT